ncbi:pentapeptide repeat-containing protein [Nodosilinea nodulosa]|uniref:pentapeptide repeat-containing protein n=1 Tax=Nodosilinea nodulosa TaxID=416001 RepID=UPI0002F47AA2|nr:pentapeptide repeat-containing protein [Nodosilinea nodulosa]
MNTTQHSNDNSYKPNIVHTDDRQAIDSYDSKIPFSESSLKGAGKQNSDIPPSIFQRLQKKTGLEGKTFWDYLQLLIVPLLLLSVTVQIDRQQKNTDAINAKHDTLSAYIDTMTGLMNDGLSENSGRDSRLAKIAASRTILTLKELDGGLNTVILGFLKESDLIQTSFPRENYTACIKDKPNDSKLNCSEDFAESGNIPISLEGADFSGIDFHNADLNVLNLSKANLSNANLENAILIEADLEKANLTGANLTGANLTWANLKGAHLQENALKNVRYCHTIMPNGTERNDDCSFNPKEGSQYKLVVGNNSATSSSNAWTVSAYRNLEKFEDEVEIPDGTTMVLTGAYREHDGSTWVEIKDDGIIGGWIETTYLVPVEEVR